MIQLDSKCDLAAGCIGGLVGGTVAWFGLNYGLRKWSDRYSKIRSLKAKEQIKTEYVYLLNKKIRRLQVDVIDLEERNERLREANRILTKLANRSGNVGFQETQSYYKKLKNSPTSREEGEAIFIDYPSYEFALVRPSSNEV